MAAPLTLTRANVVDELGEHLDGVGVRVRQNVARLINPATGREVASKPGVVDVARSGPPAKFIWTVTFDDATSWTVERRRAPCAVCGGKKR